MDAKYGRGADLVHLNAARQNPEQYTLYQPHGGAKPAFTLADWSSGGIDDHDYDEVIPVYKIPQPEPAAAAPAPTPEPEPTPEPVKEEPKGPVEYSPEIQKAKEKVQQYESNITSGNTSEQIYDPNSKYAQETNLDFSNNYDFSAKTFGGQSSKAAASFLDNKKQSVKNSSSNMGN